jgi:hypothetical protein
MQRGNALAEFETRVAKFGGFVGRIAHHAVVMECVAKRVTVFLGCQHDIIIQSAIISLCAGATN